MIALDPRLSLYPDLILICDDGSTGDKVFQIWVNQKDSGFKLQQSGKLPTGTQSISFADVGTHPPSAGLSFLKLKSYRQRRDHRYGLRNLYIRLEINWSWK